MDEPCDCKHTEVVGRAVFNPLCYKQVEGRLEKFVDPYKKDQYQYDRAS
jgi:hypothetical protein